MAEGFTPQTQANPGAAAGLGNNPFSANYWANVLALNFQTEKQLGEDQRAVRDTEATYRYNLGANQRAEPIKLRAGQNTANAQGLAESGVLAQRQGLTQTDFASKNSRLGETRRQAVEKLQTGEKNTVQDYGLKANAYLTAAQEGVAKQQEENPSAPIGAQAANPGGQRTVLGPPGTGGVVPYTETSKAGSVSVGGSRSQLQNKAGTFQWSRDPKVRERQQRELAGERAVG